MQIIIDIPQKVYDKALSGDGTGAIWVGYVKNGTLLPKGHGRMGDLDALRDEVSSWGMNDYEPSDFIDVIDQADTIIGADEDE